LSADSNAAQGGKKMTDLSEVIGKDLSAYYTMVREQTHQWVDPLTEEQLWQRSFAHGNSVGHLLLHMTGNLSYYIGARVAEKGYVRDRDREFNETELKPKAEVLAAFDRAIAMVIETIEEQSAEDWQQPYSAVREPEAAERFAIFLRCAGHAYHHVGQLIYLSRELRK
jgi:uncharacterized damage-inducible protein DinB